MNPDTRWRAAFVEHETVIRDFIERTCAGASPAEWTRAPAAGAWSPASVVLHLCLAYEVGRRATDADAPAGMRMLVHPAVAWASRTFLLPIFLATRTFPRGASAPAEVIPDEVEASRLMPEAAATRLRAVAAAAADALHGASLVRPALRVRHAYFGPLTPYATMRLLSAHTRHHTRLLAVGSAERR